mmetsp:Transcript_13918/g.38245  ORF Transcript_13918/g.38245 Transcript_13918/m.38245 type:complete len:290 (+) Transcript_13918:151-1020(+)
MHTCTHVFVHCSTLESASRKLSSKLLAFRLAAHPVDSEDVLLSEKAVVGEQSRELVDVMFLAGSRDDAHVTLPGPAQHHLRHAARVLLRKFNDCGMREHRIRSTMRHAVLRPERGVRDEFDAMLLADGPQLPRRAQWIGVDLDGIGHPRRGDVLVRSAAHTSVPFEHFLALLHERDDIQQVVGPYVGQPDPLCGAIQPHHGLHRHPRIPETQGGRRVLAARVPPIPASRGMYEVHIQRVRCHAAIVQQHIRAVSHQLHPALRRMIADVVEAGQFPRRDFGGDAVLQFLA